MVPSTQLQGHQHRAKDLLLVASHVGGDVVQDGGPQKVALGVPLHLDATPVQQQGRALIHTRLDEILRALERLARVLLRGVRERKKQKRERERKRERKKEREREREREE